MQIQYTDQTELRIPGQLHGESSGHNVNNVYPRDIIFLPASKKKFAEQNGAGQIYVKAVSRDDTPGFLGASTGFVNGSVVSAGDYTLSSVVKVKTENLTGYANDSYMYIYVILRSAGSPASYRGAYMNYSWYMGLTGSV